MTRKTTSVPTAASLADKATVLQQLGLLGAAPAANSTPLAVKIERLALDSIADIGDFAAKAGAAAMSAWDNAKDSYALERARQQARRIDRVYAAAQAAGLIN